MCQAANVVESAMSRGVGGTTMDELCLSQRRQSLVRQPALLLVIVVLHVTANIICRTTPGKDSCWPGAMTLTICDVGLLSWWAALGCKNVLLGLSVWVAGVTFLFTLHVLRFCSQSFNQYVTQPSGWLTIMGDSAMFPVLLAPITLLCVAIVGGILQHCGIALSIARTDNDGFATASRRGRYQFSVRDMLVFVMTVAASLGTAATIQPNRKWLLDGIQVFAEYGWSPPEMWLSCVFISALVTLAASHIAFGRSHLARRLVALAIVAVLPGLIFSPIQYARVSSVIPVPIPLWAWMVGKVWLAAEVALISTASLLLIRYAYPRHGSSGVLGVATGTQLVCGRRP
jgi:hypothetical protein